MPDEYLKLVRAMKALSQGDNPGTAITLPVAEDEWNTRPDTESYGIISLDMEADAMCGDDGKLISSYEGSMDLFSHARNGAGWVELITGALKTNCGPCWSLNSHQYERETGMFHWEWVFEVQDGEAEAEETGNGETENGNPETGGEETGAEGSGSNQSGGTEAADQETEGQESDNAEGNSQSGEGS